MATVIFTITDGPGGLVLTFESRNPAFPIVDDEGTPDAENLTDAQAVGIGALMAVCDQMGVVDFRVLLKDDG